MKRKLLLLVGGLGLVLVALTALLLVRRTEEDTGSLGAAATPNAATTETQAVLVATNMPTAVALPTPAATPVPDEISAEELRQLVAAAAATVNDLTYELGPRSGLNDSPIAVSQSRSGGYMSVTTVTGPPYSPTLNVGETFTLLAVNGKRYWRAEGRPWVTDADDPGLADQAKTFSFPFWLEYVSHPAGTGTVTSLSVSGPTTEPAGRCWDLVVDRHGDTLAGAMTWHDTFTVCEPSFLVVKTRGSGGDIDNVRCNTGIDLNAPDQVTVLHCGPNEGLEKEFPCLFAR